MKREIDELDCTDARDPVCPHCGEIYDLGVSDRALDVSYDDGGYTDIECHGCDKKFVAVTSVRYVYSTAIDDEHASDELWGPREPAEDETATCQ